jgi:uncharacterized membrane protein
MRLRVASGFLAGLGACVTGYLTIVHYTGARLACPTSGCETVQRSRYAELAGVPVALLGLLAFLALIATAVADLPELAIAVTVTSFLFSAYLFVVQVAVIHAICAWCVTSDVALTLLLPLAFLRVRARSSAPGAAP